MSRFSATLTICFTLATLPASTQTQPSITTRIDHAAKYYRDRDGFMGMVAVARSHRILFQHGYGYASLENKAPFTLDTRFRVGSLSKQFTAVAILLLQQDGKLKTDDLLSRYYPNTPGAWSGITLRNLLTHTSGIPDVDFGLVLQRSPHTPEELMKGIPGLPLEFPPGSKAEYANINYMLLGRVIEHASGEPYCRFLQDRILGPLKLTETACDTSSDSVPHRAVGYRPSAHGPVQVENDDLSSITGAGNLRSSARDLIRWTEALHGAKVLYPASYKEMVTPFLEGLGYGLQTDGEDETLDISHNGTVDGFFSCLDYIPRTKTTVVVLSNLVGEDNHTTPGTLALDTELVHLAIDGNAILPSEGKEAPVPEPTLRSYTGRYRSTDPERPMALLLTLADTHLYIQNEGATTPPAQMRAETASRFYLSSQEIELTFDPRNPGSVQIVDFNGISGTVLKRDPQSEQAPAPGRDKPSFD